MNITTFRVYGNFISGSLPASMSRWGQMRRSYFKVQNNYLSGGVVPALPFMKKPETNCCGNCASGTKGECENKSKFCSPRGGDGKCPAG